MILVSNQFVNPSVSYQSVVTHAHSVHSHEQPQTKGVSPTVPMTRIKHVKDVCIVGHCVSVPTVTSGYNVVTSPLVGGRLQKFWQIWQALDSNPKVVSILRESSLPHETPLTRVP